MKKILFTYSLSHFVVDLLCAFTIFSIPRFHILEIDNMLFYIVLYWLLAFGLQFIFWEICDRFKKPKYFALLGIFLNITALLVLLFSPLLATILTWLGNALFHIWWWVISLNLWERKATIPWIFVSTWAMWVFLGTYLPLNYELSLFYFLGLWLISLILILFTKSPELNYKKLDDSKNTKLLIIICFFILTCICIRSIIGFIVPFTWKQGFVLGFIFTIAVLLWKAFGWIFGDKFGFEKTWIVSLSISSILLSFFSSVPILGIIWIFLFNMTMPITLVVLSNSFQNRYGFAFGLTTLALIIWALPYYGWYGLANEIVIFILILLSFFTLLSWLYFYRKLFKS